MKARLIIRRRTRPIILLSTHLAKGHEVLRVFFYYDGVLNGNKYSAPQSDDRNVVRRWSQLAQANNIDLTVCVAAGLRRGIVEDMLAPGFRISGLGQLVEACIDANRTVVFGD